MDPLIGFALAHAEQAPLDHLEAVCLQVREQEEQPVFRRRQGAVFVHGKLTGGAGFPIEAPRRHVGLERRLEGRDEELKLVERQAGEIEELCRAGLHIGELDTGHTSCLLSWEAQYTIIEINSIEHNLPWRNADNFFDAFDNAHGRRVRRRVWVMTDVGALPALAKWPGLQAVIAVETIRMAHKQAPVTSDYRFYLSSLMRPATAFVTMIRQHWDIENKLHWSLDVTFNEDRCRIRKDHAPENVAAVRHIALNLLRQEHTHQRSLRQKRLLCSLDEHYLLTVLSGAT